MCICKLGRYQKGVNSMKNKFFIRNFVPVAQSLRYWKGMVISVLFLTQSNKSLFYWLGKCRNEIFNRYDRMTVKIYVLMMRTQKNGIMSPKCDAFAV